MAKIRNYLYGLSLLPACLVIFGNINGGVFTLSNTIFTLGVLGILEWITPAFLSNNHTPEQDNMPRLILYLHVPLQIISLFTLFYGLYFQTINGVWIIAAAFSAGLNSGTSAIVVAHELIHSRKKIDRFLGKLLLFTAGNIYFFIEHLSVHHRWVGTSKDSATARYGESVYYFFMRSMVGQIKGAYSIESMRLKAAQKNSISINHYVQRQIAGHIILATGIFLIFGKLALMVWISQCFLATFLLEYVNYIQHYGLTRGDKRHSNDQYSWESNQFASRFFLVDLSRHADHHHFASKPYHTLLSHEHSPKLPSGYAGLFFVAAMPFLWRKVMHKVLQNFKES